MKEFFDTFVFRWPSRNREIAVKLQKTSSASVQNWQQSNSGGIPYYILLGNLITYDGIYVG